MTNQQLQISYSAICRLESTIGNLALGKLEMTAVLRQLIFNDIRLIKNSIELDLTEHMSTYERINHHTND